MLRSIWSTVMQFSVRYVLNRAENGSKISDNIQMGLSRKRVANRRSGRNMTIERERRREAEAVMSPIEKQELQQWREAFYAQYTELMKECQHLEQVWNAPINQISKDEREASYTRWQAIMSTTQAMRDEMELWPERPKL